MTQWMIKIFMGLVIFMAVATTTMLARELLNDEEAPEPAHLSDQVLINNLQQQADQYLQLISMFEQDQPLKAVHPEWVEPKKAIDDARWAQYKQLFTALNLEAGIRSRPDNSLWFVSTVFGFAKGGSSKGYVYKPVMPTPQYPNLDTQPKEPGKGDHVAYRLISDQWYILYEWDQ